MKRRVFMKLLGLSPLFPSFLKCEERKGVFSRTSIESAEEDPMSKSRPMLKDLPCEFYLYDPLDEWAKAMSKVHQDNLDNIIIGCLG